MNIPTLAANTSDEQKALFAYGNNLGRIIQGAESINARAVEALKSYFDDRSDPSRAAALVSIAREYNNVASDIQAIDPIPPETAMFNEKLARDYEAIAGGLENLTKQSSDAALADAILSYNASAETYTRDVLAIVAVMSSYDVSFSSSDPGAIFRLNP